MKSELHIRGSKRTIAFQVSFSEADGYFLIIGSKNPFLGWEDFGDVQMDFFQELLA